MSRRHFTQVFANTSLQELDKELDRQHDNGYYVVNITAIKYEGKRSTGVGHYDWIVTFRG